MSSIQSRSKEEGDGDNNVSTDQHGTFKPVGLTVAHNVVENHDGDKKNTGLKGAKKEGHGLANNPAKNDKEGSQEKGNLERRANGDANGKIHLVLHGNDNGSDVLSGVTDNGDKDETNKSLGDTSGLNNVVNGVDEVVSTVSNDNGNKGEHDDGLNVVEGTVVLFLVVIVDEGRSGGNSSIGLNVNIGVDVSGLEVASVSVELEEQVQDVNDEQNNGSTTRNVENMLELVRVAGVKGGGDQKRSNRESHHGSHGLGHDGVESLGNKSGATGQEAASHDEQNVGKDGAKHGGLNNADFTSEKSDNGNNELDGISKSSVQQTTDSLTNVGRDFLSSKGEQGGQGNNGKEVEGKDGDWGPLEVVGHDTKGHKDEQDVDIGRVENGLDFRALEVELGREAGAQLEPRRVSALLGGI